jgi:glutaminyl-tRNA synthetase
MRTFIFKVLIVNNKEDIIYNNFIKNIIVEDIKNYKNQEIITRFPPEPNGYLHIGHVKSICLNFGLAKDFNGKCNLRLDDTNPEKETEEYVLNILDSVKWLGYKWDQEVKYASDYFDKLYQFAIEFIKNGLAYVCDLTVDEIRNYRGNLTQKGIESPFRNRPIAENLLLFNEMAKGLYNDGSKTLRLKIDMNSPNINMRDPVIYRIKKQHHIRTKDKWCIYPMYDYTHCISDALEGITHSCCTLEFEDHRPLYDWIIEKLISFKLLTCHPKQIEFSRLELQYTITSKRKLNELVINKLVSGWDDPRMPTISGMRRRGYTKDGLELFVKRCGISKSPNIVDMNLLETSVRDDLETKAPRVMTVLKPLKLVITNFNQETQSRVAPLHPQNSELGERLVELTKEIYIEQDDFMENPIDGWQRLSLNKEVRLRHSYIIKCNNIIKDTLGNIIELHATIDQTTLGKNPEGRKVKGVIHWVSCNLSIPAKINIYDRLFTHELPDKIEGKDFKELINPNSLEQITGFIEPVVIKLAKPEINFQFERLGYFVADRFEFDSTTKNYVFNKTVNLKDSWKK